MPPRRFCFLVVECFKCGARCGFNATTAFLLHGPPAASPPGLPEFQCHHGVSASRDGFLMPPARRGSFNATTAFLLPRVGVLRGKVVRMFQCHHGVSASRAERLDATLTVPGFNATTAFLLRWPGRPAGRPIWVSMPPRRFCFQGHPSAGLGFRARFNATTAFLLLPKEAIFLVLNRGFNATTAFLLPRIKRAR